MSDIIDRIMERKHKHVSYLKSLFHQMKLAGFTNIRIVEPDLKPYSVEKDGAKAVIREMFQIDDMVPLRADYPNPDGDKPHRVTLFFILCNSAWESLADYTIPCEAVEEKLTEITDKLGERYE